MILRIVDNFAKIVDKMPKYKETNIEINQTDCTYTSARLTTRKINTIVRFGQPCARFAKYLT